MNDNEIKSMTCCRITETNDKSLYKIFEETEKTSYTPLEIPENKDKFFKFSYINKDKQRIFVLEREICHNRQKEKQYKSFQFLCDFNTASAANFIKQYD